MYSATCVPANIWRSPFLENRTELIDVYGVFSGCQDSGGGREWGVCGGHVRTMVVRLSA
jgi:hypothetical protein